jgi:hypothetical protein
MSNKGYYLIAHRNPGRGQTEGNPGCLVGTGSYTTHYPMQNINPECCYKSRTAAENYASRLYTRYSRTAVIEVPETALAPIAVNATRIESFLWDIEWFLMEHYGTDTAKREIAPLRWYISTGRASTPCIRRMMEAKRFMLARKLHEGGSDDEVIRRILKYVGWEG